MTPALLAPIVMRLATLSLRSQIGVAILAGCITALGHAPFSILAATFVGLSAGMVLLHSAMNIRTATWIGWGFGVGYFALTLNWIVEPFLVDLARHGWMAPFALIGMAGGLALFWAAASRFTFWVTQNGRFRPTMFAASLGLVEILRAYLFTGFPWGLLAYTAVDTWAAYSASTFGPHFTSFVMLASVAAAVEFLLVIGGLFGIGAAAIMVSLPFTIGLLVGPHNTGADHDITLRILQPNAPQHQKWDPDYASVFFQRQIDMTRADDPVDVVIWPETAIPYLLDFADEILVDVATAARGAEVVVGMQRSDGARYYNSLVALNQVGQVSQIYDKAHLVPFGEYIPMGNVLRRFGIRGLADIDGAGFASGQGGQPVSLNAIGSVVPLICYEGIFPNKVAKAAENAQMMLLITNDAWFGNFAGPQQHLVQAQFRAIETGLPMVRSANTGISAVIDANGTILDQLSLNTQGFIDTKLPAAAQSTLYRRTGDLPIVLFLLLITCVSIGRRNKD